MCACVYKCEHMLRGQKTISDVILQVIPIFFVGGQDISLGPGAHILGSAGWLEPQALPVSASLGLQVHFITIGHQTQILMHAL